MAAATAAFKKDDHVIKIYQLDKLNNKINFLNKLEGICNRNIEFPLKSLNAKLKEILGDEIIDVINPKDNKNVNLMTIGKDGNLYNYKNNKKGTVVKIEDKYYQKISDEGNNWNYIIPKTPLNSTDISSSKTINNQILKFETLDLISQFSTKGKNINNTFVSILCNKNKINEILAFSIFSNKDNNIFIDAACGKNRNGEYLLNNMFDYFKKKNFETIKLTALPLVYNIWKSKYNFTYKDEDNNSSQIDDNKITAFIENNLKYFYKSSLICNVVSPKEKIFNNSLPSNFNVNYSVDGIPMELNLTNLKNLENDIKIPVEIPNKQINYFKTKGSYNNLEITNFLNSRASSPAQSPPSPAPSSSVSPAPSQAAASSSKSPAVSPASPASPSSVSPSVSPASPSSASPQIKLSAPPASVILQPRPKMEKDELTAIVSKLEANGILINYGNILKYRDVNMRSSSTDSNNICLWNCQRQTRSQEVKSTGFVNYSQCEFKNRHLILDTEFYKLLCNVIIETSGDNNNYDFIINHNTENFTLCHNHIKQFLRVKMIFSGKKTGNEIQIKNLWERLTKSVICYYKNPLFVNGTFHKDLGNFIKKSNDRRLKNCYFEIENKNGKELSSHFEVKALRNIQKGEILYF